MNEDFDYTYDYIHITERRKNGRVLRIDHTKDAPREFKLALKDDELTKTTAKHVCPLLADLCDLFTAVYFADRMSVRPERTTRFLIKLPLRSDSLRGNHAFKQKLHDLLYWFTEDHWDFQFSEYSRVRRTTENQPKMLTENENPAQRVALWSGGLDSLAGLYHHLKEENDTHYTLVSTGSNSYVQGQQKKIFIALKGIFPGRLKLIQVPIMYTKEALPTESSNRTRGFVFLLFGVVCAILEGTHTLYIHENGIGAINLPFRDCEVGLDHARSVHPFTLKAMSRLLEDILDSPFTFQNSCWDKTKAEMCQDLAEQVGLIKETVSCDNVYRSKIMQCGYCSSCLLRRQAIIAARIKNDKTEYQIADVPERKKQKTDDSWFRAMLAQIDTLRAAQRGNECDTWRVITQMYPILHEIVEKESISEQKEYVKERLLHLYTAYVKEWDYALPAIRQDFL